jgi:phage terminase large subunit
MIDVKTSVVFEHLEESTYRIEIEQGGTRSSKTYNILIWIIFSYCASHKNQNLIITICRKTFSALRGSAMRDFFEILNFYNLYSEKLHNKTQNEYTLYGNLVEFIGVDQPERVKGRKRHLLYINEINELTYEDWFQLNIRAKKKVIGDYNPSFETHWMDETILNRPDCGFHITTYLDNKFLEPEEVHEIELLKKANLWYWTVYGEGKRGKRPNSVFDYDTVQKIPETVKLLGTGMDWGFVNDPSVILDVYRDGDDLYLKLRCYQRGMTNSDLDERLKKIEHGKFDTIYYDNSRQDNGEELRRKGWKMTAAKSRTKFNSYGIDIARRFKIHLLNEDQELIKEFSSYVYKTDSANKPTNEPVDFNNHGIDAFIYVLLMTITKPAGKYILN